MGQAGDVLEWVVSVKAEASSRSSLEEVGHERPPRFPQLPQQARGEILKRVGLFDLIGLTL